MLSRLIELGSEYLRGEWGLGNGFLEEVSKLRPGGQVGITRERESQEWIRAGTSLLSRKGEVYAQRQSCGKESRRCLSSVLVCKM